MPDMSDNQSQTTDQATPALQELQRLVSQRKAILADRYQDIEPEPEAERDARIMNTPGAWQ